MITELQLVNYKCFAGQTLHPKALTLLAGLNGMGKSSVLQALLILRQSYLDGTILKTGLALNGSLVHMGTAKDVFYEDADNDQLEIGIAWADRVRSTFSLNYLREADVLALSQDSLLPNVFDRSLFTEKFQYLQAERLGPRVACAVSDQSVRVQRQVGTAGQYAEHFLHVYRTMKVSSQLMLHPSGKSNELLSQVQAWMHEVSPGTEVHLDLYPQMDIVNLEYSFITGDQRSNRYRSTSVGFGITYTLPVLTAVLAAMPGHLLLIENPEAHLHPQGQVKIGELLARAAAAGVQVFVETHSDHVLNGIRVAVHDGILTPESVSLNYFSRIREGERVRGVVKEPRIDADGRIDEWPDGFFDEWDKSLERLLKPRGK
jgi:predicted ATPase